MVLLVLSDSDCAKLRHPAVRGGRVIAGPPAGWRLSARIVAVGSWTGMVDVDALLGIMRGLDALR